MLRRLFWSGTEARLRAGWRLVLHLLLLLALALVFGFLAARVWQAQGDAGDDRGLLVATGANLCAVTLSVYLARRFIDRRSLAGLGFGRGRGLRDLLFGIGVAAVMMGLIYALSLVLGWTRFESFGWRDGDVAALVIWAPVFLMVGWYEELLSRGYWLVNLREGLNVPLAAAISAAAFAWLHNDNPHASWASFAGLFAAGLWFAYAALRARGLWLPIGAHIGWNIFEGNVFGFRVSGLEVSALIRQTTSGPASWTGGEFGPEAGLLLLPALALGAAAVWAYSRQR